MNKKLFLKIVSIAVFALSLVFISGCASDDCGKCDDSATRGQK